MALMTRVHSRTHTEAREGRLDLFSPALGSVSHPLSGLTTELTCGGETRDGLTSSALHHPVKLQHTHVRGRGCTGCVNKPERR